MTRVPRRCSSRKLVSGSKWASPASVICVPGQVQADGQCPVAWEATDFIGAIEGPCDKRNTWGNPSETSDNPPR